MTPTPLSVPMKVMRACANECERQQSGERSVADMCEAWSWTVRLALDFGRPKGQIYPSDIQHLGHLVEPYKNKPGFWRDTPVTIDRRALTGAPLISRAMFSLCTAINDGRLTPEEAHQEFQTIHPFVDGNGRAGFLLYNYMRAEHGFMYERVESLLDPVPAPPYVGPVSVVVPGPDQLPLT